MEHAKIRVQEMIELLEEPPVIDMQAFFERKEGWQKECDKVAASLHKFGILIVRDPRVNHQMNENYIDMVETYFEAQGEKYYRGEILKDCHPELSYQTGITPQAIEKARDHSELLKRIPDEEKPQSPNPPEFDQKWRFFWPIGERPAEVRNDIPRTIPEDFPEWEQRMDDWGFKMVDAVHTASEMAALGMGLAQDAITSKMHQAPHLLGPTASDLTKYDVGTAFAGFHYDLNFLTVHGKSRYPGLFIWLRNWKRMACKIPDGCLIMQAGIMFEWLTGGFVLAGFHEVIYSQATKDALIKAKQESETGKKRVLWRISSTLFAHLRYNVDIAPLPELAGFYDTDFARQKYRPMTAHEKLCEELAAINLAPKQSYCDLTKSASHEN